ncbi:hypothetical protein [Streptomyces nitrosporeus]|uniref:hypothetical protein n=1 Tax=Streptomyces nitrosporeus TaxID=28894 RepID=UPI00331B03C8
MSCVPPPCGLALDGGISGPAISHNPSGTIQLHALRPYSGTLGHSDTRITRDIYQSVLPHVGKNAAEATAELVPLQQKADQEEQVREAAEEAKKAKRKSKAKR